MAIVYCNNCKQCGESKLKGSGWITFVLILFLIVPGFIYMIWRRSSLGECKFCGSHNVIPANQKPIIKQAQQPAISQPLFENVPHINCPDCRELIRFDARKCKHCGSFIDQQNK